MAAGVVARNAPQLGALQRGGPPLSLRVLLPHPRHVPPRGRDARGVPGALRRERVRGVAAAARESRSGERAWRLRVLRQDIERTVL